MSGLTLAETILYQEDSASPLTVLKPLGAAVNDLLVMVVAATDGILSDISSATWADEGAPVDISGQRGKVFSHVVTGGDPGSWDFNYNSGSAMTGVLLRYTLADTTPVVVVASNSTASNGSSLDSPDATPSGMDDVNTAVITSAGIVSALTYIQPTGLTDLGTTHVPVAYQSIAAAWTTLTSSSPVGVQTWTSLSPTGRACGAWTILVKSSGVFDPDPPLKPPAPELPPWLLRQLLTAKARDLVGHQGTPLIKYKVAGGATDADIVLATPGPCDDTDAMVLFHGNNFYTLAALIAPTGSGTWTPRGPGGDNGTDSVHQKIWTSKITTPGVQTITCRTDKGGGVPGDEEHTAHLFVITGVDPDDFIDGTAAGNNGAASTSHISPAVTPGTLNPLLLYGGMSGTATDYTIPAGAINNGAVKETEVDVPGFCSGGVASQQLATSGSTGTRTITSSANSVFATCTIAIKAGTPTAGGGQSASGPADTTQHATTDSTAAKATAADSPTVQRTATTSSGAKNAAAATTTTQRASTTDTGQKQAVGPGITSARAVADSTGAPGTPSGPAVATQRSTTTAATLKASTGTSSASPHTATAATGQKQTTAPAAAPQHTTSGTTGSKQATAPAAAVAHPATRATTTVIPGGPATASAHTTTTAAGTPARTGTARAHPHTSTTTTAQRATTNTSHATTNTATTSTGSRTTGGAAHAADHPMTTSSGQEIPAFTPALVAVEAGTVGSTHDGRTTTAGMLDTATTTAGNLD